MWSLIFVYRLNIIACIGSILFLFFIIESVRKQRLKEAYSLIWIIMGFVFLVISVWQKALDCISNMMGIYYSPTMLCLVLIFMILIILVQYSIVISKQTENIKTLVQENALLKNRIEEQGNLEIRIEKLENKIAKAEATSSRSD